LELFGINNPLEMNFPTTAFLNGTRASTPASAESPPLAFPAESQQSTTRAIEALCNSRGIPSNIILKARYIPSLKTLLPMVLNHRSMVYIMSELGLFDYTADNFSASNSVHLLEGGVIKASAILEEFGWNAHSFKHKCSWYRTAENAALTKEWSGAIPSAYFY
jgi:hypothetical protein